MKTDATLEMEDAIYKATKNQGTHGCFEVTIGWFGKERVDYLTYDCNGNWRCYEIKTSVSDFHSKSAKTFVGHFNYFVLTQDVYDKVKDEIQPGVGVYVGGDLKKKARRRALGVDEHVLFESMIRSLSREYAATRKSKDKKYMQALSREAKSAETTARREIKYANDSYLALRKAVDKKYGRGAAMQIMDEFDDL